MLLDVGVSETKITNDECDDLGDDFMSYSDNNIDFQNLLQEAIDYNHNETFVNFNDDVTKIAINDILNEMRMSSPIQDDLFCDFINDEASNQYPMFGNDAFDDTAINLNESYSYNFNQSDVFKEQTQNIDTNNNLLDQLVYTESCSIPDMQVEYNDEVQFEYDVHDQFNCESGISLAYSNEESAQIPIHDSHGINNEVNINNDFDANNFMNYELKPYPNGVETITNQYFECSTNLPMTSEELLDDIQKYLNSEENDNYVSLYEYNDLINDLNDEQSGNGFELCNGELLQDYIVQQNQLLETLHPVDSVDSLGSQSIAAEEYKIYQCNICSFYSESLHGLSVHMRVHLETQFSCTECKFTTTTAQNLKQHQAYNHGTAYCCQSCDYVTYSSSNMRSHMLKKHN